MEKKQALGQPNARFAAVQRKDIQISNVPRSDIVALLALMTTHNYVSS